MHTSQHLPTWLVQGTPTTLLLPVKCQLRSLRTYRSFAMPPKRVPFACWICRDTSGHAAVLYCMSHMQACIASSGLH